MKQTQIVLTVLQFVERKDAVLSQKILSEKAIASETRENVYHVEEWKTDRCATKEREGVRKVAGCSPNKRKLVNV